MYLGFYLGGEEGTTVVVSTGGVSDTVPVESPYTPADPEYVDVVGKNIERLCEYSRSGDDFDAAEFLQSIGFEE